MMTGLAAPVTVLADLAGLTLPSAQPWAQPAWHLFVIRSPYRDRLQDRLRDSGIETLIHYPVPPHCSPAYVGVAGRPDRRYPVAERLAREVLSLPIGPHLSSRQAATVVTAVRAAVAGMAERTRA